MLNMRVQLCSSIKTNKLPRVQREAIWGMMDKIGHRIFFSFVSQIPAMQFTVNRCFTLPKNTETSTSAALTWDANMSRCLGLNLTWSINHPSNMPCACLSFNLLNITVKGKAYTKNENSVIKSQFGTCCDE